MLTTKTDITNKTNITNITRKNKENIESKFHVKPLVKPLVNLVMVDYNNLINSFKNMRLVNNLNSVDEIVKLFIILKSKLYKENYLNLFHIYRGIPVDSPSKARMKQVEISNQLSKMGWTCLPLRGNKYKNKTSINSKKTSINSKANVDGVIAADLLKICTSSSKGSKITILSGDSDFLLMAEVLRAHGFNVSIISGGGIVSSKIRESPLFIPLSFYTSNYTSK